MTTHTVLTPFLLETPLPAARRLAQPDWSVNAPMVDGDQFTRVGTILRGLADRVAEARSKGAVPVSLGGDCCQAIGVLAGLQRGGVTPLLVWLDAHGDFNTWDTSPSGFVGGMPLAMITGRGDRRLLDAVGLRPLADRHVVLSDARDLDPLERTALAASEVHRAPRLAGVLEALPPARPVYVHLDVDVIDPAEAPAVAYPVPGGPSAAHVRALLSEIARTREIAAASLTLWTVDQDERTEAVCLSALAGLTG